MINKPDGIGKSSTFWSTPLRNYLFNGIHEFEPTDLIPNHNLSHVVN